MDLEIHQTTPKGYLETYKVFSSFSSSFLYLSQKCLPFILLECLLWRPKCNTASDKCSERQGAPWTVVMLE